MPSDVKKYTLLAILFPLFVTPFLFFPDNVKNPLLAVFCMLYAILCAQMLKKRDILRLERRLVLLLMSVAAVLAVTLHFLTGLSFGFSKKAFAAVYIWKYILPYTVILISAENMRRIFLSRNRRFLRIYTFFALVLLDCVMLSRQGILTRFSSFRDFFAMNFFPAVSANVLFHFIVTRYGVLPNLVYRLILTLSPYLLPVQPKTPDLFSAFFKMILPLLVLAGIHLIFEKRTHIRPRRQTRGRFVILCGFAGVMTMLIMLISCQFHYGLLIIGSGSMSGTIETGDGILYEAYHGEIIQVGDIIVFAKNQTTIVHRVTDIRNLNGNLHYYTKGDANDAKDPWHVSSDDLIGIVRMKIRYIGIPTIALRSLFT